MGQGHSGTQLEGLAADEHGSAGQDRKRPDLGPLQLQGPRLSACHPVAAQSPQGVLTVVEAGDRCQASSVPAHIWRVIPKHMHSDGVPLWKSRLAFCICVATEVWAGCRCSPWALVGTGGREQGGTLAAGINEHEYLWGKFW